MPWANTHIHLPPNFSAFASVEDAVNRAKSEGCSILGASNYYDFTVYHEFKARCSVAGIAPLFGIEIVCMDKEAARAGIRYNDPVNPGKVYLCGKALKEWENPTKRADELLERIRGGDEARMTEMARLMSAWLEERKVTMPSYSETRAKVSRKYSVEESTVVLQERHLAEAAQEAISNSEDPAGNAERLFGKPETGPTALQTLIRMQLLKVGKPAYVAEEFVSLGEGQELIEELDGLAVYAMLADSVDPPCEAESSPERIRKTLRHVTGSSWGVEFMPNRNSAKLGNDWAQELVATGHRVLAGTEHNTSDMAPLRPRWRDSDIAGPVEESLWQGAKCLVTLQEQTS